MKLIFVTWWPVSWLWKWVTVSSIAKLLKSSWLKVSVLKMDPYLQVDAWTMSPYEHWEVFVTKDWAETDLDIWNYERFLDIDLSKQNNITTWSIYLNVINKERKWEYLGKTVQIIPHITWEIKSSILEAAKDNDILIVEVWWTVWDIEALPFLESIRELKRDIWAWNVFYIHLSLLIELDFSWEIKTKPIQYSISKLREYWINANMLICRTSKKIDDKTALKISMMCDIDKKNIIEWKNVSSIYEVPKKFKDQKVDKIILDYFNYHNKKSNLSSWNKIVSKIINPSKEITISIIWKYTEYPDTYKSIIESLVHSWAKKNSKININWLDSELLENKFYEEKLSSLRENSKMDAIIIPWWFWNRWVEWMINWTNFARINNIPYLWICLWMQVAVIEYARNMINLKEAHSSEFDKKTKHKVIDIMEKQKKLKNKWWTMRLWNYEALLKKWSLAEKLYKKTNVVERHRHRFELNPKYVKDLEKAWLVICWTSKDKKLVEFIELKDHPYFIATQAHPEFKSRLENPHPLFLGLVEAALKNI